MFVNPNDSATGHLIIWTQSAANPQPQSAELIMRSIALRGEVGDQLWKKLHDLSVVTVESMSLLQLLSALSISRLIPQLPIDQPNPSGELSECEELYKFFDEFQEGSVLTNYQKCLAQFVTAAGKNADFFLQQTAPIMKTLSEVLTAKKGNPSLTLRKIIADTPTVHFDTLAKSERWKGTGLTGVDITLFSAFQPANYAISGSYMGTWAMVNLSKRNSQQLKTTGDALTTFIGALPVPAVTLNVYGKGANDLMNAYLKRFKSEQEIIEDSDRLGFSIRDALKLYQDRLAPCEPIGAIDKRRQFFRQHGQDWREMAECWLEVCQWGHNQYRSQMAMLHRLRCLPLYLLQEKQAVTTTDRFNTRFGEFCARYLTPQDLIPLQRPLIDPKSDVPAAVKEAYRPVHKAIMKLEEILRLKRGALHQSTMGATAYLNAIGTAEDELADEAAKELEKELSLAEALKQQDKVQKSPAEPFKGTASPDASPVPDLLVESPNVNVSETASAVTSSPTPPLSPLSQLMLTSRTLWLDARVKLTTLFARSCLQNAERHYNNLILLDLIEMTPSLNAEELAEALTSALNSLSFLQEQLLTTYVLQVKGPQNRLDCLPYLRHDQARLRKILEEAELSSLPSEESVMTLDRVGRRARRLIERSTDETQSAGVALLYKIECLRTGDLNPRERTSLIEDAHTMIDTHLTELMHFVAKQASGNAKEWLVSWTAFKKHQTSATATPPQLVPEAVRNQITEIQQLERAIRSKLPRSTPTSNAKVGYVDDQYNYLANAARNLSFLRARWLRAANAISYQNIYHRVCVLITLSVKQIAVSLAAAKRKINLANLNPQKLPHDLRHWIKKCDLGDKITPSQFKFLMTSAYVHRAVETPFWLAHQLHSEAKGLIDNAIKGTQASTRSALESKKDTVELKENELGFTSVSSRRTLQQERFQNNTLADCLEVTTVGLQLAQLFWTTYRELRSTR